MSREHFAPGKIILSGEYAVLFGYAGVAVPSRLGVRAAFDEGNALGKIETRWDGNEHWLPYAEKVVELCKKEGRDLTGTLSIRADLPIGKGMGSSTALVVAIVRALIGDNAKESALQIENALNPGHSGFDFSAIWEGVPIAFKNGTSRCINLEEGFMKNTLLVDTGRPGESTTELIAWIRSRESAIQGPLDTIGQCAERLMRGEPLDAVVREHHKAQVELGVVPPAVQELIADIESSGSSAKVIGAGGRASAAGMVLACGELEAIQKIAHERGMHTMAV